MRWVGIVQPITQIIVNMYALIIAYLNPELGTLRANEVYISDDITELYSLLAEVEESCTFTHVIADEDESALRERANHRINSDFNNPEWVKEFVGSK